jgi:TRAP-type C4-dicarboxylate transport system permease small subunit
MFRALVRLDGWIDTGERMLCIGLLLVIVGATGIGVIFRYVLDNPLIWGADVGTLALTWLTFLGVGTLYRNNGHISASSLPAHLGGMPGFILTLLVAGVVAGCAAVLGWYGVQAALIQHGQTITALDAPRSLYSMPIIWCALSLWLATVVKLVAQRPVAGSKREV